MADRDANGRFAKGNKAGLGNRGGRPRRASEEKYLSSLLKIVTPDEWQKVITRLLDKAKDGDMAAIKMILEYAIGRPTEYIKSDVDVAMGNVDKYFRDALARGYGD